MVWVAYPEGSFRDYAELPFEIYYWNIKNPVKRDTEVPNSLREFDVSIIQANFEREGIVALHYRNQDHFCLNFI